MFGTVAWRRIQPGKEAELLAIGEEFSRRPVDEYARS
jgi:hypothetical protein